MTAKPTVHVGLDAVSVGSNPVRHVDCFGGDSVTTLIGESDGLVCVLGMGGSVEIYQEHLGRSCSLYALRMVESKLVTSELLAELRCMYCPN